MKMAKFFIATTLVMVVMLIPYQTQAQFFPTKLKVTVIDGLGNVVEGAKITLYKTEEDYRNNENMVIYGVTNVKGMVMLKKLEPISYYIDVRKDDLKNDGRGAKTEALSKGKALRVNVVIE